jgi:hypothetical protein
MRTRYSARALAALLGSFRSGRTRRIQAVVATLDREELRWASRSDGSRIGLVGRRCVRRGGRRAGAGSIGSGSGQRSRAARRARLLAWMPACRRRLASDGSGRVAGCRRSRRRRCRDAICRSASGRSSLCCAPRVRGPGDRAPARPFAVDDLPRAAAERRDSQWRSGVPRLDRAVACGSAGSASEAGEAGRERRASTVCAGPTVRCCATAGRGCCRRS